MLRAALGRMGNICEIRTTLKIKESKEEKMGERVLEKLQHAAGEACMFL